MSLAWGGNASGAPAFTTSSSFPLNWTSNVEFVFSRVGVPWIESRCAVDSVTKTADGSAIHLAQPCWDWFMLRGCQSHAPFPCTHAPRSATVGGGLHPRRIENIPQAQQGRFSTQGSTVFYALGPGETRPPMLVTAGTHELVRGTAGVTDLHFSNVTFELSAHGPRPDSATGHMETQTVSTQPIPATMI